jgi:hypothetical protein
MTISLVFVFFGLVALLLVIYLLRGASRSSDLDSLAAQLHPIDVNAFRNLIDVREEEFLRQRLPAREFHKIHRERMLAALDYVRAAGHNAGILVRLAQAAREHPDSTVAAAAESLFENALEVRLFALRTIPRLYASMLFPQIGHTPEFVAERYETAARQAITLRLARSRAHATASPA